MPDRTLISGQPRLLTSTPRRSWPATVKRRPHFGSGSGPHKACRNHPASRPGTPSPAGSPPVSRRLAPPRRALVRHRGQYRYVAALLPGRSDPPRPPPGVPGLRRPLGHRDLQAQHRPVHRIRTARLVRAGNRHARTRDRRHLRPLRRPRNRKLTALTGAPGKSAKVECTEKYSTKYSRCSAEPRTTSRRNATAGG